MKYFYNLLALIVLIPFFSSAQVNYKAGYVIGLNGDTLKGYVDYREWDKSPKQILFNSTATGSGTICNVANCNGFGITGYEYYRKFVVSASMDKTQPTELSTGLDTSQITDTAFLKVITQGAKVNLYTYADGLKQRIYVAENNGSPFELIYHLYVNPDDPTKVITVNAYRRQLERLAVIYQPADEQLKEKISTSPFDARNIRQIVNEINGAGNYTETVTKSGGGSRFFVGIGAVNTQNKYSGTVFDGQSHSSFYPNFDFGFDFLGNKSIGALIFRLELGFTGNKAQFSNLTVNSIGESYNSKLSFNQFITYINPQILYNFYNTSDLKVYAAFGALINYSANSNKNYTDLITLGTATNLTYPDFPDLNSVYFNVSAKVGVVIKNWDVFVGYNPTAHINDNYGTSMKASQAEAGVKYLFGIK